VAAAKLVVTATRGGSQITLVGASGTPLLSSKVFREPRGKGATLRALKGLLSEHVAVDDQTAPVPALNGSASARRPAIARTAKKSRATTTARRTRRDSSAK
jgi:hypothetical protein